MGLKSLLRGWQTGMYNLGSGVHSSEFRPALARNDLNRLLSTKYY